MRILLAWMSILFCACSSTSENQFNDKEVILIKSSNLDSLDYNDLNIESDNEEVQLLCNRWQLTNMYLVKNGSKKEFPQPTTIMEFFRNNTFNTEVKSMNAKLYGTWHLDTTSSTLTLIGTSMNGSSMDTTIQQNSIIELNQHNFSYEYGDPVTGNTLVLEFEKLTRTQNKRY